MTRRSGNEIPSLGEAPWLDRKLPGSGSVVYDH